MADKSKSLTIRNRVILLAVALTIVSLGIGASGALASQRLVAIFAIEAKQLAALRNAHINLLQEIQEWKNLLLRGQKKEDYDKYYGGQRTRAAAVDSVLKALLNDQKLSDADRASVAVLIKAHDQFLADKADAISRYEIGSKDTIFKADHDVRGRDRPIQQGLEELSGRWESSATESLLKQAAEFLYLIAGITIAGALLCGLFSFIILRGMDSVVSKVYSTAKNLTDNALKMKETSLGLSTSSQETSQQTTSIATSVTQVNQNLQMISSAVTEMSVSVSEVARQTADASRSSKAAHLSAETAMIVSRELGTSAAAIGEVTETIKSIAAQTNLLALNAAIEAAAAGDAGKGFGVVAAEVKELARQSALSSGQIKEKIQSMQQRVQAISDSMEKMLKEIAQVNEVNTLIASAAEEQSITAREISSNVEQISIFSQDVTKGIQNIVTATQVGATTAEQASNVSGTLEREAVALDGMIAQFRSRQLN